jgi:hypothetical protein
MKSDAHFKQIVRRTCSHLISLLLHYATQPRCARANKVSRIVDTVVHAMTTGTPAVVCKRF